MQIGGWWDRGGALTSLWPSCESSTMYFTMISIYCCELLLPLITLSSNQYVSTPQEEATNKSTSCELNSAFCHLKLGDYKRAIDACDRVLDVDPCNAKVVGLNPCRESPLKSCTVPV